jgi:hypothetical protein
LKELVIEQLVNTEGGESVWTPYIHSFSPETDFNINQDNLDGEICQVGIILIRYGEAHSLLVAQAERHKRLVEQIHAELYLAYRGELATKGEKTTAEVLRSHVIINPSYQEALKNWISTQRDMNLAEAWWKNAQKKADLLQTLAYKLSSEIKRGAI